MLNARRGIDKMRNIIFIAPPAAGKGTISDYLVKNYGYEHISTGDLLRDEIASGSEFGKEIEHIIESGSLVDDAIVIQLVEHRLQNKESEQPFILDGFPRTLIQAQELDEMFRKENINNNMAIYLNATLDTVLKRVVGRVICPKCKRSYNLNNEKLKPIRDYVFDDCGGSLIKRSDDNVETLKVRFASFMENTKPVLDFYQNQGILKEIDASLDLDRIYDILINEAKND